VTEVTDTTSVDTVSP